MKLEKNIKKLSEKTIYELISFEQICSVNENIDVLAEKFKSNPKEACATLSEATDLMERYIAQYCQALKFLDNAGLLNNNSINISEQYEMEKMLSQNYKSDEKG